MSSVAVINFVDEDYEGQVGELVNAFEVRDGRVNIAKDPGGPLTVITSGEDGGFVLYEVPKTKVLGIRVY